MSDPVVLIANSVIWPNVAHLAIACTKAGFAVETLAPAGHPVHKMNAPRRSHVITPFRPRTSLRGALLRSKPILVIPCDDRMVLQLYSLHAAAREKTDAESRYIVSVIENSLGAPEAKAFLSTRTRLSELGALSGVSVPATAQIPSLRALKAWSAVHGFPLVLKLDASTGGRDVKIIRTPQELAAGYLTLKLRRSYMRRIKNALWNRDPEPLLSALRGDSRAMSVQAFVEGRPGNCAVACWRGEVLGAVAVETVKARSDVGVATVVRRARDVQMTEAARAIVRTLKVSGMIGCDFIIGEDGAAKLIEVNPRATQINHLPCSEGSALPDSLCKAANGQSPSATGAAAEWDEIALFPQEWQRDKASPYLTTIRHDVPEDEPSFLSFYGYLPQREKAASLSEPMRDASEHGFEVKAVLFSSSTERPALFVLPGPEGHVSEVAELARRLGRDQTVYGLDISDQETHHAEAPTVGILAERAIATIRSYQPKGPYRLLGYSFGGLVAFEIAVQLRAAGETADFVGLIGSSMSQRFWPAHMLALSILRRTGAHIRELRRLTVREGAEMLGVRARRLARLVGKIIGLASQPSESRTGRATTGASRRRMALDLYRPGLYDGTVTILQPKMDHEFHRNVSKLWARHAKGVKMLEFPCDHFGFARNPGIVQLVAAAVAREVGAESQRLTGRSSVAAPEAFA